MSEPRILQLVATSGPFYYDGSAEIIAAARKAGSPTAEYRHELVACWALIEVEDPEGEGEPDTMVGAVLPRHIEEVLDRDSCWAGADLDCISASGRCSGHSVAVTLPTAKPRLVRGVAS